MLLCQFIIVYVGLNCVLLYIGIDKEITIPVDYKDLIKDPSALIVLCLSIHYRLPYLDCLTGMDYNSLLPKLNVE